MKLLNRVLLASALLLCQAVGASATQYINLGVGEWDLRHNDRRATNLAAEWRGDSFWYDLKPMLGATINSDGGSYLFGGFAYDWEFAPNFYLTPTLAAGWYHRDDSSSLGGPFEFREALEVSYKFEGGYRLGAEVYHMSNASIYDHNPGVEAVMATFSIPLPKY